MIPRRPLLDSLDISRAGSESWTCTVSTRCRVSVTLLLPPIMFVPETIGTPFSVTPVSTDRASSRFLFPWLLATSVTLRLIVLVGE